MRTEKIMYFILYVLVGVSCFLIGNNIDSYNAKAEKSQQVETIRNNGNGIEFTTTYGTVYTVDNEHLETVNYIDTSKIIDWNTNDKELSVLTENDFEFYAYKD